MPTPHGPGIKQRHVRRHTAELVPSFPLPILSGRYFKSVLLGLDTECTLHWIFNLLRTTVMTQAFTIIVLMLLVSCD
jgi:hypothetical protein